MFVMCSEVVGCASSHIFRFSAPAGNAHRCLSRSSSAASTRAPHRLHCGCQRACSTPHFRHRCSVEFATPNTRSNPDFSRVARERIGSMEQRCQRTTLPVSAPLLSVCGHTAPVGGRTIGLGCQRATAPWGRSHQQRHWV